MLTANDKNDINHHLKNLRITPDKNLYTYISPFYRKFDDSKKSDRIKELRDTFWHQLHNQPNQTREDIVIVCVEVLLNYMPPEFAIEKEWNTIVLEAVLSNDKNKNKTVPQIFLTVPTDQLVVQQFQRLASYVHLAFNMKLNSTFLRAIARYTEQKYHENTKSKYILDDISSIDSKTFDRLGLDPNDSIFSNNSDMNSSIDLSDYSESENESESEDSASEDSSLDSESSSENSSSLDSESESESESEDSNDSRGESTRVVSDESSISSVSMSSASESSNESESSESESSESESSNRRKKRKQHQHHKHKHNHKSRHNHRR